MQAKSNPILRVHYANMGPTLGETEHRPKLAEGLAVDEVTHNERAIHRL